VGQTAADVALPGGPSPLGRSPLPVFGACRKRGAPRSHATTDEAADRLATGKAARPCRRRDARSFLGQRFCSPGYPGSSWPRRCTARPTRYPGRLCSSCSRVECFPSSRRTKLKAPRVLATGTVSMLAGLVLLFVSVRLSVPNLALFLVGGGLIAPGAVRCSRGPRDRARGERARKPPCHDVGSAHHALRRASVPVVGAGIALDQGASAPVTVLWFAVLVGLGVSISGWALLGRRPRGSVQRA